LVIVRRLAIIVVLALAHLARADTLDELCAAREATCHVLERAGDYAAIVVEAPGEHTYAIAMHDHGWQWLAGASVDIYTDGDAYLGGNCCYGKAGPPHYAFAVIDGVAILKVDLPLQRFYKEHWGGGSGPVAPAYERSEGVACWRAAGGHCKPLRFATCLVPDHASIAVDGLAITSRCKSGQAERIELN
jgi:hypothetical protein